MTRTITDWRDGRVIWSGEAATVKDAIYAAVAAKADLSSANLSRADLSWANLSRANLSWANLSRANLSWANLSWANLSSADLSWANLSRADLSRADLLPVMVLLASWGEVSDALCRDLMAYDAANHPDPKAFAAWANGGACPCYGAVTRCANFTEKKELYRKVRRVKSAYELMVAVIREKCADSDFHPKKKEAK